jgi:16S rRNA (guanine1516-N2)-methyltransferase
MQFVEDNKNLSFIEFSERFPVESVILAPYQDNDWQFKVIGKRILFTHGEFSPVCIDISSILQVHKTYFFKNSLYKEPLARAIGLKKGKRKPSVLDATAGFLGDTLLMYAFEIPHIDCYERHPVAASLAQNAINNADANIKLFFKSSIEITKNYDVCFYDPMYAEKNTKTAPKKEMKIFREVVGFDNDCVDVAKHLLTLATERLVIKRSVKASYLLPSPHHSIKGKSTRYDVYLK